MRHDTHKLDEIIKIATAAGYLCSNGNLTKTGREFIELCKDDDEKIRLQSQIIFPLKGICDSNKNCIAIIKADAPIMNASSHLTRANTLRY